MKRYVKEMPMCLISIVAILLFGAHQGLAATKTAPPGQRQKITQVDRQAAANRAATTGFALPQVGLAAMAMPGSAPRYFSHPNYANSPLPIVTTDPATGAITITGGLRKFVNGLPGLGGGERPVLHPGHQRAGEPAADSPDAQAEAGRVSLRPRRV